MKRVIVTLGLIVFLGDSMLFYGCGDDDDKGNGKDEDECYCTEIFAHQAITIVDESGQPATDASLSIIFKDSGRGIDCSDLDNRQEGKYCIMSDNYVGYLDPSGKTVEVTIEKGNYSTCVEEYIFNTDSCRCHINLMSGNTKVTLSSYNEIDKSDNDELRLAVWSEFDPYTEVIGYLEFLAKHNIDLYIAVHHDKIGDSDLKELFFKTSDLGIEARAWILLDFPQGYWPNEENVDLFYTQVIKFLDWIDSDKIPVDWIIVDMEMSHGEMKEFESSFREGDIGTTINIGLENFDPDNYLESTKKYQSLVHEIHQRGLKVMIVTSSYVLDDIGDGDTSLQDIMNTPCVDIDWDEVSFMVYRNMPGEGFGPYLVYSYSLDAFEYFKERAAIDVGLVGSVESMPGGYMDPGEIRSDIAAARVAGIDKVHIYALDQIMEQEKPDDWVDLKNLSIDIPENDGKTDSFRELFFILDKAL